MLIDLSSGNYHMHFLCIGVGNSKNVWAGGARFTFAVDDFRRAGGRANQFLLHIFVKKAKPHGPDPAWTDRPHINGAGELCYHPDWVRIYA